uniref:Uncharacterized protein n=1 Tax=Rhizophora mucronata TaxID=61149 RepID=A0A2P2J115_RHIMU
MMMMMMTIGWVVMLVMMKPAEEMEN